MPCDILGLGCVAVDETLTVEQCPAEDSKSQVINRATAVGGSAATALLAAAKLGASCAYAGTLGDDPASQLVIDTFQQAGIETSLIRRDPEARPIRSTIVASQSTGSRTVFYDLHSARPAAAGWPPDAALRAAKLLLIDQFGREGIIPAARTANAAAVPVVLDLEHANTADDYVEFLAHANHIILAVDLAARITGHFSPSEALGQLWRNGHEAIVLTAGAEGLWYRTAVASQPRHFPAYAVPARDTTGCGDVFRGAYAAALLRGDAIMDCIRFGLAAAALRAAATSPDQRLPTREAILTLIATGSAMV